MVELAEEASKMELEQTEGSDNSAPPSLEQDSSSDDSDDESVDEEVTKKGINAEKLLAKALNLKEEGNSKFKDGKLDLAIRSYRKGTRTLKHLNEANMGDDQVKGLLVSLQNNMAMVFAKQSKWKQCADVAKSALGVDPKNIKAIFRRSVALRNMGDLDAAKALLKEGLKVDSSSKDLRRELAVVKSESDKAKKRAKMAFGGAFNKGTGGLYEDKEEEKIRKEMKRKEEEKKAAERKEKEEKERKRKWEDECVSRMSKSEPPISYEDWCKEKKEEEEKEKKKKKEEEERKKKERRESKKKAAATTKSDDSSDDEDLGLRRGYKINSSGRKTSYFNNELTEEQKNLIGDITPKPISASDVAPPAPINDSSPAKATSAWNSAGTWEEKDTSDWCQARLKEILKATVTEEDCSSLVVKVSELKDVSGDASVVVSRGKKRYVFDLACSLKFEVTDCDDDTCIAKGSMSIPDISSTAASEGDWELQLSWKKGGGTEGAKRIGAAFCESIKGSLTQFVTSFNASF